MNELQDNQFYFFRLKPTGVHRDWQIGHVIIDDDQCQIFTIGRIKPMIVTQEDLAVNDFVLIGRPGGRV